MPLSHRNRAHALMLVLTVSTQGVASSVRALSEGLNVVLEELEISQRTSKRLADDKFVSTLEASGCHAFLLN